MKFRSSYARRFLTRLQGRLRGSVSHYQLLQEHTTIELMISRRQINMKYKYQHHKRLFLRFRRNQVGYKIRLKVPSALQMIDLCVSNLSGLNPKLSAIKSEHTKLLWKTTLVTGAPVRPAPWTLQPFTCHTSAEPNSISLASSHILTSETRWVSSRVKR